MPVATGLRNSAAAPFPGGYGGLVREHYVQMGLKDQGTPLRSRGMQEGVVQYLAQVLRGLSVGADPIRLLQDALGGAIAAAAGRHGMIVGLVDGAPSTRPTIIPCRPAEAAIAPPSASWRSRIGSAPTDSPRRTCARYWTTPSCMGEVSGEEPLTLEGHLIVVRPD